MAQTVNFGRKNVVNTCESVCSAKRLSQNFSSLTIGRYDEFAVLFQKKLAFLLYRMYRLRQTAHPSFPQFECTTPHTYITLYDRGSIPRWGIH